MTALADGWADPARLYSAGRRAQQLSDAARAVFAETLGVRPHEVSFWPSGTAAAQAAPAGPPPTTTTSAVSTRSGRAQAAGGGAYFRAGCS